MSALQKQLNRYQAKEEIQSYARTLYENYRARIVPSGRTIPHWRLASPVVRREFIRDARTQLGY